MKSSFAARRKPKAIVRQEDEDENTQTQSDSVTTASVVRRPNTRPRQTSSKQISLSVGASRSTSQNASDDEEEPFVLKKSNLSQQAMARNAQRKSGIRLPEDERLSAIKKNNDRPSYSNDALALLRNSTPTTPASGDTTEQDLQIMRDLDVAAKFGADHVLGSGSASIPTDAEIAEKKARRARLASEMKYHEADSDSDGDQRMLDADHDSDEDEFRMQIDRVQLQDSRSTKYPETRFVRDDEDILEGFDEFTQASGSGRIEIGRKAEKAAVMKARAEMRNMIDEAEASETDASDDSERERKEIYEANQTRKAIGSTQQSRLLDDAMPPRLPALPTLGGVLDKIRAALEEIESMRQAKQREIDEIEQERREIAEREDDVQRALEETAEQYQRLSVEAGLKSPTVVSASLGVQDALALRDEGRNTVARGLENLAGGDVDSI